MSTESTQDRTRTEEIKIEGGKVLDKIKELIHQGNIRRIILKNEEGKTLIEIPLTLGLVGRPPAAGLRRRGRPGGRGHPHDPGGGEGRLGVSANQVVHPNSGKLKSPNTSFPGDSGEHPQSSKVLPLQSSLICPAGSWGDDGHGSLLDGRVQ